MTGVQTCALPIFTYGLARGWDPEKSFDLAAWAAAQVATGMGGRAGIPAKADLRDRGYD